MAPLSQRGVCKVRGTAIKGSHKVSCKGKRGENAHYDLFLYPHNPFKKMIIKKQK